MRKVYSIDWIFKILSDNIKIQKTEFHKFNKHLINIVLIKNQKVEN